MVIGFLNDGIRADWSLLPWEGMRRSAREQGVDVVLLDGDVLNPGSTEGDHKNRIYRLATSPTFDALIAWKAVLAHRVSDEDFDRFLDQFPLPQVLIEGGKTRLSSVEYDNTTGLAWTVRHLIRDHGLTRLAFVGMHPHHSGFEARYQAFVRVAEEEGLTLDPALVKPWLELGVEQDAGILKDTIRRDWLGQALARGAQAFVCVADSVALQVMHALDQRGVLVPQHVAVTGYDDFRISAMVTPPLTTVHVRWEQIGSQAVSRAVALVKGDPVSPAVLVEAHPVVRQSCGCPGVSLRFSRSTRRPGSREELVEALTLRAEEATYPEPRRLAARLVREWESPTSASDPFLLYLEQELSTLGRTYPDLGAWQDLITLLEAWSAEGPHPVSATRLSLARLITAQAMDHAREFRRFHADQEAALQTALGEALISSFGWDRLGRALSDHLPRLGVPGWSVVVYREGRSALMLAGRAGQECPLPPGGLEFEPGRLLPEGYGFPGDGRAFVVQSLHFEDQCLGYIVFETSPGSSPVFEVLARQISNAVEGTKLVSHLRSSLDELTQTQAQLVQSEKAAVVATLVKGLSHELNTPIGVIVTAASAQLELLKRAGVSELATTLTQAAALIERNADRASHLITRIKLINPDELAGVPRWFRPTEIFPPTVAAVLETHSEAAVVHQWEVEPGFQVFGNPALFHLILGNLTQNSLDHGFRGRTTGTIRQSLHREGDDLVWTYADDGCGTDAEGLRHLFEPFGSSLSNQRGEGLGTYIVQVLITQRMGGSIRAEVPADGGLSYTIRLPQPVPL